MADTLTLRQLRKYIAAEVKAAESLRGLAADVGISHAYLSNFLRSPQMAPGPAILRAFGFQQVETLYTRIAP